jgi:hypothetical protein
MSVVLISDLCHSDIYCYDQCFGSACNADPDPAFSLNANPDPDPGSQTNAVPDPGQT